MQKIDALQILQGIKEEEEIGKYNKYSQNDLKDPISPYMRHSPK